MDEVKMRTNGFERPLHPLQLLSWVVFGSDVLIFAAFCIPLLDHVAAHIGVSFCYALSVFWLVAATAKATRCNPADPTIYKDASTMQQEDFDALPFCMTCNSYVNPASKHCRACNKCVHGFDHHCKWLNNCVGENNYRAFASSISAVAVMTGIILGGSVYLLFDYIRSDEQVLADRIAKYFGSAPEELFLAIFILMLVINLPLFLLDLQLLLFHMFLTSQNLTTYEYIVRKRDQASNGADEPSKGALQRCATCCMDNTVLKRKKKKPKDTGQKIPDSSSQTAGKEEASAANGVSAEDADLS